MALTITGLSKTYPNGVRALKNVSLEIGNNMFGLLGPNGAGKSSLMRTVATLQDPDSGANRRHQKAVGLNSSQYIDDVIASTVALKTLSSVCITSFPGGLPTVDHATH